MNTKTAFYIVSVENGLSPGQEEQTTDLVRTMLDTEGLPYKPMVGWYKGQRERSMLIPEKYRDRVLQLARAHHQESVLFVDTQGSAWLIYMDGRKDERLGMWRQKRPDEVPESATLDPETGATWVASGD